MPLYELTLNLRGKRCLLLPKRRESYSFRCLNKPIFNRKFISNFPQQIDRFLINLLIRARLISHGGVVVSLCRKISSVNGHTSFSICYVINPSGRWKKMKRVWFKWKVRQIIYIKFCYRTPYWPRSTQYLQRGFFVFIFRFLT